MTTGCQGKRYLVARSCVHQIYFRILLDAQRSIRAVGRSDKLPSADAAFRGERLLRIAGLESSSPRQQPDLIEVRRLGRRGIELAMPDAAPGGHVLKLARPQHFA